MNGRGVFLSMKIGRLIATLDPLRCRIFAVRVLQYIEKRRDQQRSKVQTTTYGNRACGFVISSGRKRLWLANAFSGSQYGSVNIPGTPRRGNEVNVTGSSFASRCRRTKVRLDRGKFAEPQSTQCLARHLYRISRSTLSRSSTDPLNGEPGVDSSIYRPYSG